jgi:hypothetical protein
VLRRYSLEQVYDGATELTTANLVIDQAGVLLEVGAVECLLLHLGDEADLSYL